MDSTNANGLQRPRYDSNALLMLPAPLAAAPQAVRGNMTSSSSTIGLSRHSGEDYMAEAGSASRTKLIPTPQSGEQYSDSHESNTTLTRSPVSHDSHSPRMSGNFANIRNPPSPSYYPADARNQYRHSISGPVSPSEQMAFPSYADQDDPYGGTHSARGTMRGVRLTDSGPVPGPEGVRRVSRPSSRRPTSQIPPQNRYSRPESMYTLPPGAAAPQPSFFTPPNN